MRDLCPMKETGRCSPTRSYSVANGLFDGVLQTLRLGYANNNVAPDKKSSRARIDDTAFLNATYLRCKDDFEMHQRRLWACELAATCI